MRNLSSHPEIGGHFFRLHNTFWYYKVSLPASFNQYGGFIDSGLGHYNLIMGWNVAPAGPWVLHFVFVKTSQTSICWVRIVFFSLWLWQFLTGVLTYLFSWGLSLGGSNRGSLLLVIKLIFYFGNRVFGVLFVTFYITEF